MCEREGRDADMCPFQMHCPKRCLSCGEDGNAVCMNPMPPTTARDDARREPDAGVRDGGN